MTGIHALIIEDDRASIEVLAQLLHHEGVTSTSVFQPSGLTPDDVAGVGLVFLDLDMPGMNGYEVYQVLRNRFGVAAPIIAYTANTNERATVHQLGFDGLLAKPLDGACFSDQLRRIMAGEPLWDEC